MKSMMYVSSEGVLKDPKTMNTEYLINALAKSFREIFSAKNVEEYNKFITNIQVLSAEMDSRLASFLADKSEDDTWI